MFVCEIVVVRELEAIRNIMTDWSSLRDAVFEEKAVG